MTQSTNGDPEASNSLVEKPSQAEGERDEAETPEGDMGEAEATEKPSQAEGDRATIEEDLKEKGANS